MKRILLGLLTLSLLLCAVACGGKNDPPAPSGEVTVEDGTYVYSDDPTDYVLIEMRDGGKILAELYPDAAPITVENFKSLVAEHFYDGLLFHRISKDFVIQTGDPTATGMGGSGKEIKGEFLMNGVNNPIGHEVGVLSMARKSKPYDSATSQFFIVTSETHRSSLDGLYAAFGKVIAGMDVVNAIAAVPCDENEKPLEDQVMKSIRFVTLVTEGN